GCNDQTETVKVARAVNALVTQASGGVVVGGNINDTGTLSGGFNPTGTITFTLFGPNNGTCAGAPIFTSSVAVAGNGSYPSSSFTTTAAGVYRWIASYSGDANNLPVATACNDANENVTVTPVTP